jgi:hypothetical protein
MSKKKKRTSEEEKHLRQLIQTYGDDSMIGIIATQLLKDRGQND